MTYEQKESLAEKLKSEDPVLYEEMRKRFVFWEDIYSLKDNEISILFTVLSYDDISPVLKVFNEDFREKIKKEFSDTAWKIISEKSEYVSEENIKKSKEKIISIISNMIEEGKIKHPYVNKDFLLTKES